ncbi:MAG: HAD family phosphatase [Candidatus Bathyarchaeota archaeon]|nr:HAD family phosphatase [Candidatus Bathyarchaeota archaeon]
MTVGILLDMDGTLVDSMPLLKQSFNETLETEGLYINKETEETIGNNLSQIMGGNSRGFTDFFLVWRFMNHIDGSILKKIKIALISSKKLRKVANSAPFIKGAAKAIESMKKNKDVKIGIVTSRSKQDVISRLNKSDLRGKIDVIVTRDDVNKLKPSPEQILVASKRLGLLPKNCAIIGDMSTDVEAAKKAGSIAIGVASGIFNKQLIKSNPDFIAQSIIDIPNALDEIINRIENHE